ncbi:MAG: metallophosphoesterase [Candidatus Asgardarchaeia archaeon]
MNDQPSKYYLITDTHFFHDKMTLYCNRPSDFDRIIINQWRNIVKPQDVVFHLGDVIWGSQDQLISVMNQLPGIKILIRGNHDRNHSNNWFIRAGFAAVVEKVQVSGIVLSHFPAILSEEELKRGIINVHGHFHNNPADKWEREQKKKITKNHYILVLEDVGYMPISLQSVLKRKFIKSSQKILESER